MRDRQCFNEKRLENGINTFRYTDDTPYTHVILQVPVGSSNSIGAIAPGTFHFLEHALTLRSKLHPQEKEFDRLVGLKGGSFGATTNPFHTTYEIKIPSKHLENVLPGFFSQIFEPLFNEQDITREQGVIASERQRKERWFPSGNEIGQYLCTQWQWDCPLSLRQRLGYDEDLAMMTPRSLSQAHQYYFSTGIWVMIGGSGDTIALLEELSSLKLSEQSPEQRFDPLRWVNKEYHERSFRDISRFELRYGGIITPRPKPIVVHALRFILSYLTNSVHGELYKWLREEKGWAYEVRSNCAYDDKSFDWLFYLPLRNREQVRTVHCELPDRIAKALTNETAINQEVDRISDYTDAFRYRTLGAILIDAQDSLQDFSYIISEVQLRKNMERMRDAAFLQQVWKEHFTPEQTGCFCATPLD